MKFSSALFVAVASFLGASEAQLTITTPSSAKWWVANSVNLLEWSCQASSGTQSQYTVVVYNPTIGQLAPGLPIIGLLDNFICSKTIDPNGNFPAASNYTVALVNPQNRTDIWAVSEPFEVKPEGSTYPPSSSPSALPSSTGTQTGSVSGSSTGTGTSSPSPTTSNAAIRNGPLSMGAAAALVFGALLA